MNTLVTKPLLSGQQQNLTRVKNDKPNKKKNAEPDYDSEQEEAMNKDFFESMIYWTFEENRRKSSNVLVESRKGQEIRKKMLTLNSQANNY